VAILKAPERIETARLVLRKPAPADAEAIFSRYSGDAEVTRFLGWARHRSLEQTHAFLRYSDKEWQRWPAGPYLLEAKPAGALIGGTGLAFETPFRAATGYVLARDSWGAGYASEALRAMVSLAAELRVRRLYALCHPDNPASQRVLEKCEFAREGVLRRYVEFPNLQPGEPVDVVCYSRVFDRWPGGDDEAS
jgi:RimJ/RimL family protein N-acetyltransferase